MREYSPGVHWAIYAKHRAQCSPPQDPVRLSTATGIPGSPCSLISVVPLYTLSKKVWQVAKSVITHSNN
uniref:Uncharacterized protein n=1 Tax=Lutzomyia longipalpis TaxID=7200 RepID=A0A1B0CX96_LUTLO